MKRQGLLFTFINTVNLRIMRTILISCFLFFGHSAIAQIDTISVNVKENKKYIVWYAPSKATHVYGFMFNFFPSGDIFNIPAAKIYGAEFNLNPIGIFVPYILLIHAALDPNTHGTHEQAIVDSLDFTLFKKINGLQIGLINLENTTVNGLDINASGSFDSKINGVTISLVMNRHYVMNGLTIAPIANYDTKCKGVQIGLINSSRQLKGFQIGLWNINQKRSLPFVNWSFK